MMKIKLSIPALTLFAALALSSCGGSSTQNESNSAETTAETTDSNASTVNTIVLETNDDMQFSQVELHAIAGQAITLTLKHTGKMSKTVMGHDWVLLKQGTDIPAFANVAMSAQDEGYVPQSEIGSVIAHTKLIGGGESDTIQFTATEKGTYDYICSFPGHYAIMKGKLIVQ